MTKQNAGTAEEESPFGQEKYDDLWGRPGYLIRRLHQIHVGLFSEACGGLDLTAVQYAMLSVLFSGGGKFGQLSLSKAVGVDRTSGADVIKRLERRGLIAREPSTEDRRAFVVSITEQGKEVVRQVRPMMEAAQDRLVSPLTSRERDTFTRLLRKMIEANNDASRAPMA